MDAPAPPAWVRKRDGRLEPFDADKISRALFAATESCGRPDAFLARELTDGVVHFLTDEAGDASPTTIQIAELVTKIVRELGQPALAAVFANHGVGRDRSGRAVAAVAADAPRSAGLPAGEVVLRFAADAAPEEVLASCARSYTLQAVFARDLAAARNDGLLTLTGLEAPGELAGLVVRPGDDGTLAAVERARRFAGDFLVLDGPEYWLARVGSQEAARSFARDLAAGLRLTGLRAVVNLNAAAPPSWAGDLAGGPLFAGQRLPPAPETLAHIADELAHEYLSGAVQDTIRVDWHLCQDDMGPAAAGRLAERARLALGGAPLHFVFDRPRRPVALAEGVDRQNPAVLLTVGLHLPRLAEQPGVDGDASRFLKKLGSLARLALSAAVQKRDFLRRQERGRPRPAADSPAVTGGFLLDRARLVAAPVGLDAVVRRFTGGGLCSGKEALDFGKQIVQTLRDVLRRDGGASRMATCLDGPASILSDGVEPAAANVAGLTPWDAAATPKAQLRVSGAIHALAEGGTAALLLPERPPSADALMEWLRIAWAQTDVTRLCLARDVGTPEL